MKTTIRVLNAALAGLVMAALITPAHARNPNRDGSCPSNYALKGKSCERIKK